MKSLLAAFVIAFTATTVSAQQQCSNIIALARTKNVSISNKNTIQTHASNFCSEYYRAKSTNSSINLGVAYEALKVSFGSSGASADQVASKYCKGDFSHGAIDDAYQEYVEFISPDAYSAYETCIKHASKDMNFIVDPIASLQKEMNIGISYVAQSGSTWWPQTAQIKYSTSEGVSCSSDNSSAQPIQLKTPSSAILKCVRSDYKKRSFVTVIRADAADIPPLNIPWPEYDDQGNKVTTIDDINQRIFSIDQKITSLESKASRARTETGVVSMRADGTRPINDGSYCADTPQNIRGIQNGRINFQTPFSGPPKVALGISSHDVESSRNFRIVASVLKIDANGFNYQFFTWCNTVIHEASFNWIASLE